MYSGFVTSAPVPVGRGAATSICRAAPLAVRSRLHRAAAARMSAGTTEAEVTTTWPSVAELSKSDAAGASELSVEDIMKILPHRYPFLLLDRVVRVEPGKRAIGVKSVTVNEPFFPGHFPDRPIMPGVLQVEALAQLGGIVMLQPPFVDADAKDVDFFFGGVDKIKWRKPVVPGDTLVMEMNLESFKKSFGIAKMSGKGYVNGQLVVEGNFTLVMVIPKKE